MSLFRLFAVLLVVLLLMEMIFFCMWAYISTKNLSLIEKYWFGVSPKTSAVGLTKSLSVQARLIYFTRMSVILLLVLDIFSAIISSF